MSATEMIESVINRQIDFADRDQAERKMTDCLNIVGASARLKATTAGALERAKGKILRDYPDLNSRKLKMLIDSETAKEQEDYILAERLNVSLFRIIDGLKSLLSIQGNEISWK